jgi:hypothetical protein
MKLAALAALSRRAPASLRLADRIRRTIQIRRRRAITA